MVERLENWSITPVNDRLIAETLLELCPKKCGAKTVSYALLGKGGKAKAEIVICVGCDTIIEAKWFGASKELFRTWLKSGARTLTEVNEWIEWHNNQRG